MKHLNAFLIVIVAIFIIITNASASVCTWFRGTRVEDWSGDNNNLRDIIKRRGKYISFWEKKEGNSFTSTENCPPYNKYGGRRGCLLKFAAPVTIFDAKFWTTVIDNNQTPDWYYAPGYLRYCGEETAATSYFNPKIRVRHQSCNAIACWHNDSTLSHGDCAVFATSLGIPLLRLCARIAIPYIKPLDLVDEKHTCAADINNDPLCQYNAKDDPGYTRCYHLNTYGGQEPDVTYDSVDNNCKIRIIAPKLCVYVDPSLTSLSSLLDPFDYNPINQPLHSGSQIFPVGKILIELINAGVGLSDALASLVGIVVDKIGLSFLKDVVRFIGQVIQFIGSKFIDILKNVFDLNRVVNPEVLGCVELPLGPFPPPFYNELQKTAFGKISITPICTKEELNLENLQKTNIMDGSQCAVSNIHNNVINNAIRISNSYQLPLCSGGEEGEASYQANQCIKIQNIELFGPSVIRKKYNDILRPCNHSNPGEPCINYNGCQEGDNKLLGCQGIGFRVLYTTNIKGAIVDDLSKLEPSDKFNYCLPDCVGARCPIPANPGASSCCDGAQLCQRIYGVDVGNFDDKKLVFHQNKIKEGKNGLVKESFKFSGKNLIALITRTTRSVCQELLQSLDGNVTCDGAKIIHEQTPDDICVYNTSSKKPLIGCVKRATPPLPTAFKCSNSQNNHFKPDIGIKLKVQEAETNYSLEGCIEAKHSHHQNSNNFTEDDKDDAQFNINLAGYDYAAYVTDSKGSVLPNVGTKWGKYDSEPPAKAQDVLSPNAKYRYLRGIEFINNEYVVGGKLICINPNSNSISKCPLDEKMCVLAKVKTNPECIAHSNTTQTEFDQKVCKEVSYSIEDRINPSTRLCTESSDNYPNCLKLKANEYYQLEKNNSSNSALQKGSTIKTEEEILQTIGNCSAQNIKSKECVSYFPRKYIYRFNSVQEILKCNTDSSRCTVNVQKCTNNELMDLANTKLTDRALRSESSLIGIFQTNENSICSSVINNLCKNIKYKCKPAFTISDNGTVIDIETCTDDALASTTNQKNKSVTEFICSTTKLESCNKLSKSAFHTFSNNSSIKYYNGSNLLGELVEVRKYVNKLDTQSTITDPKFCGNRIQQCPKNKLCTTLSNNDKFILGDEQEYVIKRCPTELCYAKNSEEKNIDRDNASIKLPYESDEETRFRSKSALELGLCQVISDIPKCKQEESYNAIWPETNPGDEAIGKCKSATNPKIKYRPFDKNSLKRLCVFDPAIDANSNVHFTSGDTAKPVFDKPHNRKIGCEQYKVRCSEKSENGVIWPAVEVDEASQPKCINSSYKLSNPNAIRKCELDRNGNPVFTSPISAVTCSASSSANKCSEVVENGVIWSEAEEGKLMSTPRCLNSNHILLPKKTFSKNICRRMCKNIQGKLILSEQALCLENKKSGTVATIMDASSITCSDPNK